MAPSSLRRRPGRAILVALLAGILGGSFSSTSHAAAFGRPLSSTGEGCEGRPALLLAAEGADGEPFGTAPCPGVRPGAMIDADGGRCTANFLFRGSDGARYIGTAGHCTLEGDGNIVYPRGKGPGVKDAEGSVFGEVAYAALGPDSDFALIRLKDGVKASGAMCFFGGPSGWYDEHSADPVILSYYGNGLGVGNLSAINQPVLPARSALAPDTRDPKLIYADGVANFGDSGAGVIEESTGRAVGVLVGIGAEGLWIRRLRPEVSAAAHALGVRLRLASPGV